MAYVPGQKLNEDQPQAPQVSGPSAPSVGGVAGAGGGAAGSSEVSTSNATQGGGGTGFVNIDKYLAANKGAGQDVKARADKAMANDAAAFGNKLNTATAQMKSAQTPYTDPSQLVSNVTGASNADAQAAAVKAAQDVLNASYGGPKEVGYDIGNTDEAKRAKALSNAQSAGKQIAADNGTLAQYGTGLSAIDRAIYGSSGEVGALNDAKAAAVNQVEQQKTKAHHFGQEAEGTAQDIAQRAADAKAAFGGAADKIKSDAQAAADKANAERDKAKGSLVPTAEGRATWDDGSGAANASQFIDADKLNAIGTVLNDPSLSVSRGPAYVAGKWNYNNDAPQQFGSDAVALQTPSGSPAADFAGMLAENANRLLPGASDQNQQPVPEARIGPSDPRKDLQYTPGRNMKSVAMAHKQQIADEAKDAQERVMANLRYLTGGA